MIRTLVIDDDFRVARIHASYVGRVSGFTVVGQAHNVHDAVRAVADLRPDLVLLDLYLPDGHGLDMVRTLTDAAQQHPDFIVITAARDAHNIRGAMQLGAVHYLVKPFRFTRLRDQLTAYRDLHQRMRDLGEASQEDVDALYSTLRTPTGPSLPKRHSAPTMALIQAAVRDSHPDVSATEVAAMVGISRPTAQRYLSLLAQQGVIQLHLRYGGLGRPEQRYRAPS
jgi:response regulator of citrate/malate metabolism